MRRRSLILRQVLASTAGKIGVTLAVILVVVSLLVVLTFPLDFGPSRWSNPAVWADYPKAVPPAWTALLSADEAAEHQIIEATEPTESTERGARPRGRLRPRLSSTRADEAPSFLSFSLGEVTYAERPPSLSVTLLRPDGTEVPTAADDHPRSAARRGAALRAPRRDAPARADHRRARDRRRRPRRCWPRRTAWTSRRRELQDDVAAALFGAPDENGELQPLHGEYTAQVRVALADAGRHASAGCGPSWAAPSSACSAPTAAAATWPRAWPSGCPSRCSSASPRPP